MKLDLNKVQFPVYLLDKITCSNYKAIKTEKGFSVFSVRIFQDSLGGYNHSRSLFIDFTGEFLNALAFYSVESTRDKYLESLRDYFGIDKIFREQFLEASDAARLEIVENQGEN